MLCSIAALWQDARVPPLCNKCIMTERYLKVVMVVMEASTYMDGSTRHVTVHLKRSLTSAFQQYSICFPPSYLLVLITPTPHNAKVRQRIVVLHLLGRKTDSNTVVSKIQSKALPQDSLYICLCQTFIYSPILPKQLKQQEPVFKAHHLQFYFGQNSTN